MHFGNGLRDGRLAPRGLALSVVLRPQRLNVEKQDAEAPLRRATDVALAAAFRTYEQHEQVADDLPRHSNAIHRILAPRAKNLRVPILCPVILQPGLPEPRITFRHTITRQWEGASCRLNRHVGRSGSICWPSFASYSAQAACTGATPLSPIPTGASIGMDVDMLRGFLDTYLPFGIFIGKVNPRRNSSR